MKIAPFLRASLLFLAAATLPLIAQATGGNGPRPLREGLESTSDWLQTGGVALSGLAILFTIVIYLNGSVSREKKLHDVLKENLRLKIELEQGLEDRDVSAELPAVDVPETHLSRIRSEFSSTRLILVQQLSRVAVRANLNLALGITISLGAIALLLYELWRAPLPNESWLHLFSAYFPKIFTCLFIEILAFFFLRLYRESLNEIRNCEADLRDLAARQVAIEATWDQANSENPRTKIALEMLRLPPRVSGVETNTAVTPEAAIDLLDKLMGILAKKDKPAGD